MARPLGVLVAGALIVGALGSSAAAHPGSGRPVRSGAPTSGAPTLTGFLAAPTDQLAVPGMLAGAEVTPEGDLYTGWAEYELRFGVRLTPWEQPTRTLPDPGLPLLASTLADGSVQYTQTMFAVAVGGRPVAYESVRVTNHATTPRVAQLAMAIAYTRGRQILGVHGLPSGEYRYERPVTDQPTGYYDQPGQSFSQGFTYTTAGRDLDRSGLLLARGPASGSRPLRPPHGPALIAVHDERLFTARLPGGATTTLTWQIPLEPPPAGAAADQALDAVSLTQAHRELERVWSAEEAGMMGISVPEQKVAATYRAAIMEILASRYETAGAWVQASNKLQYQALWLRDAALQTQALDLVGLHRQAAQNLAFMDGFQQPDGLFISRAGQYDGLGQALWALDQHAQLSHDPAFAAAQLGRIEAAVDWLSQAIAGDPLGLLPASNPGDDELVYGHITGDDLWAAAGLRSAVADATLAGAPDLAAAWQQLDDRFESSLDRAIAAAVARTGHISPTLEGMGGQDWGNYGAAYPVEVLPATSAAVRATLAWARAHMIQGLATYDNGRSLHDYLGFSVYETELKAGEVEAALDGLYAELVHTTSTDQGWEWDVPPWGYRGTQVDLAPHGTFAADYVALLRNLLVTERPDEELRLLAGASPAWLAPGQRIELTSAPTAQGTVSFTERSSAHGETLTWSASTAAGTSLTWALPGWARNVRISAGRLAAGSVIELPSSAGTLTATFSGRRPAQSYALAVAALNRAYRAHGRPAPLVAATR
jgi:hypothetical protein